MSSSSSNQNIVSDSELSAAVGILRAGGVIAYPTETVYGLGAAISCRTALQRIYQIKGRAAARDVSFMVDGMERALYLCRPLHEKILALMSEYWPGPLTIVASASDKAPRHAVSQHGAIGLRHPAHEICAQLVGRLGEAVATTSANPSGLPPAQSAQAVRDCLGDSIDIIVDGGVSDLGIASTVIDVTADRPLLLREGAIPFGEIMKKWD